MTRLPTTFLRNSVGEPVNGGCGGGEWSSGGGGGEASSMWVYARVGGESVFGGVVQRRRHVTATYGDTSLPENKKGALRRILRSHLPRCPSGGRRTPSRGTCCLRCPSFSSLSLPFYAFAQQLYTLTLRLRTMDPLLESVRTLYNRRSLHLTGVVDLGTTCVSKCSSMHGY